MWLKTVHPGPASIDCNDCKQWLYNLETGKRATHGQAKRPIARPKGHPLQCSQCPKKSPEEAKRFELTTRNRAAYRLYLESKAAGGVPEPLKSDPEIMRDLRIIEQFHSQFERRQLVLEMAPYLLGVGKK